MKLRLLIFIGLSLTLESCFLFEKPKPPVEPPEGEELVQFNNVPDTFPIKIGLMDEASGIVASRTIENGIWVQEDGGNQPDLFLINKQAELIKQWRLPFENRDWEDIAFAVDPINKKNYLYIGEIGDNAAQYEDYAIYRFEEPKTVDSDISAFEKFSFKYTGASLTKFDAEALIVEPASGDIYIVTKRELNVNVFKISYPQSTSSINDAVFLGTIRYPGILGGDISSDGKELILKNQYSIYYWKLKDQEDIFEALSRSRDLSPSYEIEMQGEAIAFDIEQNGFFTLSERNEGPQVSLRYYGKIKKDN